ncbi:beta-alanine-activating enzyme isoform X2 [Pleurodeles waltl]|uniref:beta-alanine-activating enzyme isoform X2 n=1 Tax=Pleurodeles waltl TaxID=8319 RepID=UPI0037093CCB
MKQLSFMRIEQQCALMTALTVVHVYILIKRLFTWPTSLHVFYKSAAIPQRTVKSAYIAILKILQVPAAYSPIDPGTPPNVAFDFMKRCNFKYILVQDNIVQAFKKSYSSRFHKLDSSSGPLGVTLIKVQWYDSSESWLEDVKVRNKIKQLTVKSHFENENVLQKNSEEVHFKDSMDIQQKLSLAYVLHTSGTTGTPKIVRVPHKCIIPNILHLRSIFNITEHDLLFLASPLTFDPSVIEMFVALTSGACLLIVPKTIKMMPHKLCDTLFHSHKVTVLQATPTLLRTFGSHYLRSAVLAASTSLRVLALGGETFPALSVLRKWRAEGNQTIIFNLYGVTEVSCWASFYRIPEEVFGNTVRDDPAVPLGIPLLGTIVEVRDANGSIVEEGEGQLFLGGKERICLLDDEASVSSSTMRETGDWVTVKDGNIMFLGRKDNQIKRHGKRLNIEYVQQVVEGFCEVEACAVTWYQNEKLVLFVVPRDTIEKKSMFAELQKHLNSYAVPDDIFVIETLPLTSHGKTNTSELNRLYKAHLSMRISATQIHDEEELWDVLQFIWKTLLGTCDLTVNVSKESVFLYCGGDSLKSLRFQEEIENLVGKTIPGLLEVIINNTLSDIHNHISNYLFHNKKLTSSRNNCTAKRKRKAVDSGEFIEESVEHSESQEYLTVVLETSGFIALSRGNLVFSNYASLSDNEQPWSELQQDDSCCSNEGYITSLAENITGTGTEGSDVPVDLIVNKRCKKQCFEINSELILDLRWKSNTGKCVDASPLAIISINDYSSGTIYIGSHSHRMKALDLSSGKVKWEKFLGDRIESAACVSRCGKYIIVGCYDGIVYFLKRQNGETYWTFTTENAVKSSPAVDPSTGFVFIGSHDQHAYAFNLDRKECVWKQHCGGGAIFSSPALSIRPHHLYIATLGGLLLALNPDSGSIIWKYSCEKPLFSSPRCTQDCVCVGCVDQTLYCFSHHGEKIWHFSTNGPIFSTPCISGLSAQAVFFGSHDGFLYCCSLSGGLKWKFPTSAKVYATPFYFCARDGANESFVAAASTDGTMWILEAESGILRATYKLPGEVFSSPVICGTKLIVGCRNDYVYCLDLYAAERKNTGH